MPWRTALPPTPRTATNARPIRRLQQRVEHRRDADQPSPGRHVPVVARGHLGHLRLLAVVGPQHPQADEVLLEAGRVVRERLLRVAPAQVDAGPEVAGRTRHEREHREREQREGEVDARHQDRAHDEDRDGVDRVHERRPDRHAHRADVAHRARQQVADALAHVERGREAEEVVVEIGAQAVLEVPRHGRPAAVSGRRGRSRKRWRCRPASPP